MNCKECPYGSGKCFIKCKNRPARERKEPRKRINQFSKKRSQLNAKYLKINMEYLNSNKICQVYGTPATEVHHKAGRIGYADDWARLNDIPLLIDTRYFLAVSRKGHRKIEENPEWAKENGYSIDRL